MSERILIAHGDLPVRAGLRLALASAGFAVAGEVGTAAAAIAAAENQALDLALIDAGLPGGGLEAVRRIARLRPAPRVVVVSHTPGGDELLAAVRAGAAGYLGEEVSGARLPHVLRGVLAGEVALPRRHTAHVLEALRAADARRALVAGRASAPLSMREWDVLDRLCDGATTAEIAHDLGISQVTARRHISALVAKLGVADRAAAAELVRSAT